MAKKPIDVERLEPLDAPREVDRLTIILSLIHDHQQDQPVSVAIRGSSLLSTTEQTWQRRVKIGKDWTPLDIGWFRDSENAGLIVLENLEGRSPARLPSEEERQEIALRVVEVQHADGGPWLLTPGYPLVGLPARPSKVYLRCQHGEATVKITVFPK